MPESLVGICGIYYGVNKALNPALCKGSDPSFSMKHLSGYD